MKALKFLMRSLVFSLLNLYTSCLWAGWSNRQHHATLTSCRPWHRHALWCAITAGMFPESLYYFIFFLPPYLCGNASDFFSFFLHRFFSFFVRAHLKLPDCA